MKAFVAYKLPNSEDVMLLNELCNSEKDASFKIIPFHPSDDFNPVYFSGIPKEISSKDLKTPFNPKTVEYYCINKQEYQDSFEKFQFKFKDQSLSKAILSRIIKTDFESVKLIDLFNELIKTRPKAFIYLFFHPAYGYWLGATPEVLLTNKNNTCTTVSLAGTSYNNKPWSQKELTEQELVTTYIENVLSACNIKNVTKKGPETITAGPVKHLKTTFTWVNGGNLPDLIKKLHPTPAVCGLPKQAALDFILPTEKHDRGFYSGYLGPTNLKEQEYFVNLRCLNLQGNKAYLFVGGGLTIDSICSHEWEETEQKAKSLLAIMENL